MNPYAFSVGLGLIKGLTTPRESARLDAKTHLFAPALEEVLFRGVPAVGGLPAEAAVTAFALAHALQEFPHHSLGSAALRLAEVAAGGYLYQQAFDQRGITAAITAHALHNIAVSFGRHLRKSPRRRRIS